MHRSIRPRRTVRGILVLPFFQRLLKSAAKLIDHGVGVLVSKQRGVQLFYIPRRKLPRAADEVEHAVQRVAMILNNTRDQDPVAFAGAMRNERRIDAFYD